MERDRQAPSSSAFPFNPLSGRDGAAGSPTVDAMSDAEIPLTWRKPPPLTEERRFHEIKQEIHDFVPSSKSCNAVFSKLRDRYDSIKAGGPGDRWDDPRIEYLGLAHLEREGVVPLSDQDKGKTKTAFTRWVKKEGPFPFSRQYGYRLLRFLWNQPKWHDFNNSTQRIASIPNAYYFALVNALECGHATHENLSCSALGLYRSYHRSTLMPNRYVIGLLAVVLHNEAIRTFEVHRLQGRLGNSEVDELSAAPRILEIYEGCMVKKSGQILIHAFDCITRAFHLSIISNVVQSTLDSPPIKRPARDHAKFQVMSGIATGVVGQLGFYSTPAVYTRLSDFNPDSRCLYATVRLQPV